MSDVTLVVQPPPTITATLATGQGPAGPKGDQGDPGTGGDLSYEHDQGVASAVWTITHNLGKVPSVTVIDSAGDEIEGHVNYPDPLTQVVLTFSAPFSGKAYLN